METATASLERPPVAAHSPAGAGPQPGSTRSGDRAPRRRGMAAVGALAVFVAAAAISAVAARAQSRADAAQARQRLEAAADDVAASLSGQMARYEHRLRAVQALYSGSDEVTRQDFARFVDAVNVVEGIDVPASIVYVRRVAAGELAGYEADLAAAGLAAVTPAGPRDEYFVADQAAPVPLSSASQSVDVRTFPERRATLEAARDLGVAMVTPPITLVSDSSLPVAERPLAFALYLPVYEGAVVPPTVEERRERLLGWAGTALRADAWLADVAAAVPDGIEVEVADAGSGGLEPTSVLGRHRGGADDDAPSGQVATRSIGTGGRTWTVSVRALGTFAGRDAHAELLAIAGLVMASLLAALVWVQGQARSRAYQLVDETTATLREREHRLRLLADNATDLVARQDADGRILYASPSWSTQLGWAPETLVGRSLSDLVHPEDWDDVDAGVTADRLLGATTTEFVARLRAVDGAYRWFEARGRLLRDERGRVVERQVALRDVSARQRAEAELVDSLEREREMVQRLRAASETRSNIVSGVSHELRTPLTNVLGYVEMLAEGDAGPLSVEQQRMLHVVERNTRRLLSLIEDLLTMSQIESGRLNLEAAVTAIDAVLDAAAQSVALAMTGRDLQLEVEPGPGDATVHGDPEQLERVFVNLLTNAVKFTPDGGRIRAWACRQQDEVVVTVADTGLGIPFDEQPRLFERFFRSSIAHEKAIQGTGLGLAIAKGIVEHHGGRIALTSEPGRGTEVTVRLPFEPSAMVSAS